MERMPLSSKLLPGLALLAAFVALAVAAGTGLARPVERALTEALQVQPLHALDIAGSLYGTLGAAEFTAPAALVLALLIARRNRRRAVALLLVFVLAQALGIALKRYLPHPGPPGDYVRPGWLPIPIASSGITPGNSFPSGHTLCLVVLLVMAAALRPPRPALIALAALGGVCLLLWAYMGAHWATDVLGGALLGASLALLAVSLTERPVARPRRAAPSPSPAARNERPEPAPAGGS